MNRRRRLAWAAVVAGIALALAACGSANTSSSANQLLSQTFTGVHHISSGNVVFALTVEPSGSSTIRGPIGLSLGGPFQSLGSGKLPASEFRISLSGMGRSGSVAVLSTGTKGYVTLQGTSYPLPQATFQKLESNFAQVASSSTGGGSGSGALHQLGITPLNWLRNPTIVGTETVGGASTTHIRAAVNLSALVNDLSKFLQKAASLGISGTSGFSGGLSPTTRSEVANAIRNPSFDVWTGTADKTMRKLQIGLTVPITGQLATLTGGANSAAIGLTVQYADVNQPQTITPPTAVRPFTEFSSKLQTFLHTLSGGVSGISGSSGGGTSPSTGASSTPSTSSSAGLTAGASAAGVQSYSQCIQAAGSDVSKMQQCASLLSGK